MARAWIAVASAEHVRIGRQAGFMQVCHGKASPLRRITPGDRVIYYSPTVVFGGKDRLQAFTAIGAARDSAPYQVKMESGFRPGGAMSIGRRQRKRRSALCSTGFPSDGSAPIGATSFASACLASAMRMPI